jgi:hypothetical protein
MRYFKNEVLNGLALELRDFAEKQAVAENTTFWKILRNKTIVSICNHLPRSIDDFSAKKILIGKQKIDKYGEQIIEIVSKYCENEPPKTTNISIVTYQKGVMIIKQGGFYYGVSGNDALLLNKHLGYKLFGVKTVRTGFPVSGEATVLKKLDSLSIDYDLINQVGYVIVSRRFDNNRYEIIEQSNPNGIEIPDCKKIVKKPFKERIGAYIDILQGLSEGVDVLSGEIVEGLSDDLKLELFEMSIYFDERLKTKEKLEQDHHKQGQKWSAEEDEQLLTEFNEGKSVKEMSALHQRNIGAIRSRLSKLGVQL